MKHGTQNTKHGTQSGFTLVEMIIYLAIVSTMLVSISYLILDLIGGQSKSAANQEVNQNSRFITQRLISDIKAASDFSIPSEDTLNLTVPGDDIVYSLDAGSLNLTRQVGAEPAEDLNSSEVEVTGSFIDNSFAARSRNVGVSLIISYVNPDNLLDLTASTTADFSIELRGRK